jgi:tetratricopeptide (TPR) repeat protein
MRFIYQLRRQRIGLASVDTVERRVTRRSLFHLGGLGIAKAGICFLFVGSSIGSPALAGGAPNGPGEDATVQEPSAGYVGREACVICHEEQVRQWSGSHHDLAMQEANEKTVLGNFEGTEFDYYGTVSRFYRQGGRFMVRTDGPDGRLTDYEVKYTFGVDPLQQYLIAFPGGRLQALGIAWDTRPAAEGGQRWFHLYPDEKITHDDPLHWTGPYLNWNSMCAECHSTDLHKGYDPAANRFETTWSEVNVSCEACHGPGARHIAWAEQAAKGQEGEADKGLAVSFTERRGVRWTIDPETGNARRSQPRETDVEIETCARCHSRRGVLSEDYAHGRPLMDTHLPQLLTRGMYYPDGQMQDEVYVYGSFIQSKMHRAGVTCSDCHEPHSLQLRVPGNGVCLQCHLAAKYDSKGHHFHARESPGAACVACHMPERTYMVVDRRRDHSMRVPRPELSVSLGTPNACTQCHADKDAQWAAAQVEAWYGRRPEGYQRFAETLHAARTGGEGAAGSLAELARDPDQPVIARATALSALRAYPTPALLEVVRQTLHHDDPMMRAAAVDASEALEPAMRMDLLFPLLNDPVRAVRIKAAGALAGSPPERLKPEQRELLGRAMTEYVATQAANAERPEALANVAGLYADFGMFERAEELYRTAIRQHDYFVPAYVNLADLYRVQQQDEEGERILRQGLQRAPDDAGLHHALGLALVRERRLPEAVESLARAAELAPESVRYGYVYGVALNSVGRPAEALTVLEEIHRRHPVDRDVLLALAMFSRSAGNTDAAVGYAKELARLYPDDRQARVLLAELSDGPQ